MPLSRPYPWRVAKRFGEIDGHLRRWIGRQPALEG